MSAQLTFDLDQMIAEANPAPPPPPREPYTGRAPLHFTTEFYTVSELFEAYEESRAQTEGIPGYVHVWKRGYSGGKQIFIGHHFEFLQADLRCNCLLVPPYGYDTRDCFCVGDILTQVICETCEWHVIGSEQMCVAAMHDHSFPGWRDLPVVPLEVRPRGSESGKPLKDWLTANYPVAWCEPHAPIITERESVATRSVPGMSPWKGYDISSTALREPVNA